MNRKERIDSIIEKAGSILCAKLRNESDIELSLSTIDDIIVFILRSIVDLGKVKDDLKDNTQSQTALINKISDRYKEKISRGIDILFDINLNKDLTGKLNELLDILFIKEQGVKYGSILDCSDLSELLDYLKSSVDRALKADALYSTHDKYEIIAKLSFLSDKYKKIYDFYGRFKANISAFEDSLYNDLKSYGVEIYQIKNIVSIISLKDIVDQFLFYDTEETNRRELQLNRINIDKLGELLFNENEKSALKQDNHHEFDCLDSMKRRIVMLSHVLSTNSEDANAVSSFGEQASVKAETTKIEDQIYREIDNPYSSLDCKIANLVDPVINTIDEYTELIEYIEAAQKTIPRPTLNYTLKQISEITLKIIELQSKKEKISQEKKSKKENDKKSSALDNKINYIKRNIEFNTNYLVKLYLLDKGNATFSISAQLKQCIKEELEFLGKMQSLETAQNRVPTLKIALNSALHSYKNLAAFGKPHVKNLRIAMLLKKYAKSSSEYSFLHDFSDVCNSIDTTNHEIFSTYREIDKQNKSITETKESLNAIDKIQWDSGTMVPRSLKEQRQILKKATENLYLAQDKVLLLRKRQKTNVEKLKNILEKQTNPTLLSDLSEVYRDKGCYRITNLLKEFSVDHLIAKEIEKSIENLPQRTAAYTLLLDIMRYWTPSREIYVDNTEACSIDQSRNLTAHDEIKRLQVQEASELESIGDSINTASYFDNRTRERKAHADDYAVNSKNTYGVSRKKTKLTKPSVDIPGYYYI